MQNDKPGEDQAARLIAAAASWGISPNKAEEFARQMAALVQPVIEWAVREQIARAIEATAPESGPHILETPRRSGLVDAYATAARIARGG